MSDTQIHNADNREILPLILDASVDLILTDHPDGSTRNEWDEKLPDAEREFLAGHYSRISKPNSVIALMYGPDMQPSLEKHGFTLVETLRCERMKRGPFPPQDRHVPSLFTIQIYRRGNPAFNAQHGYGQKYSRWRKPSGSPNYDPGLAYTERTNNGERVPTDLLAFPPEQSDDNGHHFHPHQKQIGLIRYLIKTYTHGDGMVFDGFAGSCVVGVACIEAGRRFILIERDRTYFAKGKAWIDDLPPERFGIYAKEKMGYCTSDDHKGDRYVDMSDQSKGRCNACTHREEYQKKKSKGFPAGIISREQAKETARQITQLAKVKAILAAEGMDDKEYADLERRYLRRYFPLALRDSDDEQAVPRDQPQRKGNMFARLDRDGHLRSVTGEWMENGDEDFFDESGTYGLEKK